MTARKERRSVACSWRWSARSPGARATSKSRSKRRSQPKLDIAAFQRVLVAGLRRRRRRGSRRQSRNGAAAAQPTPAEGHLRVIEAEALPLAEIAAQQSGRVDAAAPASPADTATTPEPQLPPIKEEKDLEPYEKIFANVEYWKKIGEEHQSPLIVTGTVLFRPHTSVGLRAARAGNLRLVRPPPRRAAARSTWSARASSCGPTFVFIDGRTGETLHSETFREEILYNQNTQTPALSSFFELMDRLLPTFLNTMSAQKIRGTRVLLK